MASVLRFFLITFAVSWACFSGSLLLLGTFAPAIVAIGVTAYERGTQGVFKLLSPIFQADAAGRWYVFALSYMALIEVAVAVTLCVVSGNWPAFGSVPWYVIIVSIVLATPLQAG